MVFYILTFFVVFFPITRLTKYHSFGRNVAFLYHIIAMESSHIELSISEDYLFGLLNSEKTK